MNALRLVPLALAAFASVATSQVAEPLPEPDACDSPQPGATIDMLEIGVEAAGTAPFEAYEDGAPVTLVIGGQGSSMVPLRIRVAGEATPACLSQTTQARAGVAGEEIGSESSPLRTYDLGDGTRATETLYLPLYYSPQVGSTLELEVSSGGTTTTVALTVAAP